MLKVIDGAVSAVSTGPTMEPRKPARFSEHQLWVTPYRDNERYAGGTFPISSKGTDGLAVWTKENRGIEDTDIVAWYTFGFHHVAPGGRLAGNAGDVARIPDSALGLLPAKSGPGPS